MMITLRDITNDNFRECINLKVADEQRGFVASNMFSLAEAKADSVSNPYAIYADEQMVGFIMYDFNPQESRGYITRLMIDEKHQGNGYGYAAMQRVIDRLKAIDECHEIQTSYVPANVAAATLYASLGFAQTGEVNEGETVVRMSANCGNTSR